MDFEKSCGAVVYSSINGDLEFLIVKHRLSTHWGFPKGHVEKDETEEETALREIYEETGLKVKLDNNFRISTKYHPRKNTLKEVVYFLGESNTKSVKLQEEEIGEHMWVDFNTAMNLLTFKNDKKMIKKVRDFLNINA
ncbi:NUDIX domain-containing protein [Hathewaya histolytica]|uniref:Bis(5'-nucleosyl)-tetraphosphatase [asymmetrical] n=1 Tax=Hathewaya histolytica TaxID=1498 RepID=A0A4U9R0R4_HATHI|nr:NUDIX domain-containing protein [Hathewaya histolytica]VTQ82260.1 NTP pyrophosphohydrolase including oxidative damage repair enzyme [Hathewaya histolytica]